MWGDLLRVIRSIGAAVAAAVAAGTLTFTAQTATAAVPAPVAVPAAAAVLPEVVQSCAPGQTDINHASVEDLGAALAVDRPIASRVVVHRPYLQPSDLLVVEGIGPERLAAILASGAPCATPLTTPPASGERCQSSSRVDLQSAAAVEIAERAGVNTNAAASIVAVRPFATLAHVTPERVPGVGKGVLDRVVAASCLTPNPVRTDTTTWRWAYPAHSTTAVRDGFRLTAPAGVVDDPSGAWLRITPITEPHLAGPDYPSADFHVEGLWRNGVDQVVVTVPAAGFAARFDETWQPYLAGRLAAATTPYSGASTSGCSAMAAGEACAASRRGRRPAR